MPTASHIIRSPAIAWLQELGARGRAVTPAEKKLAVRLRLVLKDERAAERAAVLEALAVCESSRTRARDLLGLSHRKFYNVLEQDGMMALVNEQAARLGHVVQPGPFSVNTDSD